MKKEIEIKAKVDNIDEVLLWLSNNALFNKSIFQEDILYDFIPRSFILDKNTLKSDEFMRIRCTAQKDLLTHKIIRRDAKGNFICCDEEEAIIKKENSEKICNLLSAFGIQNIEEEKCQNGKNLGCFLEKNNFKELIRITKNREEYTLNEFNIAIDEVLNLGYFIEIENIQNTVDDRQIERIRNKEIELLKNIKISSNNIVNKGYLDLIMENKDKAIPYF